MNCLPASANTFLTWVYCCWRVRSPSRTSDVPMPTIGCMLTYPVLMQVEISKYALTGVLPLESLDVLMAMGPTISHDISSINLHCFPPILVKVGIGQYPLFSRSSLHDLQDSRVTADTVAVRLGV